MNAKLSAPLIEQIEHEIERLALPKSYLHIVTHWLYQLSLHIHQLQQAKADTLTISFNGAQGSGKSTLTHFVQLLLQQHFHLHCVTISIDDFYLKRTQRHALAQHIHPLFITRGVPGTHDLNLATDTIKKLKHCSASQPCYLPSFDKSTDNPHERSDWKKVEQPVDVILFEGWCLHAPAQNQRELLPAINALEKNEDAECRWRNYSNEQLKRYHNKLFSLSDQLIFIQIPDFNSVYQWRALQEHKLAESTKNTTMNEQQLHRFIQHFERITKNCLKHLPQQADAIIRLNQNHQITEFSIK